MDEACTKVLEMLAAGKVTADDARAMIDALSPPQAADPASAETIERLGKLIGKHGSWRWNWRGREKDGGGAGAQVEECIEFPMAQGDVLRVRAERAHVRLTVRPEAERLTIKTRGRAPAEVAKGEGDVSISAGPEVSRLAIESPPLGGLELVARGAHARLAGVSGRVHADVSGGHLRVSGESYTLSGSCAGGHAKVDGKAVGLDFSVSGGSCSVSGLCLTSGEHRLAVRGGHASVGLLPGCSVRIRAKTVGGYYKTDLANSRRNEQGERVIGAGDALLVLQAAGGHVSVRDAKER